MSRTPKKTSKAKTAATGNQPSTRHRDTAGDVLLPLLGAQLEPVDADGTGNPLRSLPCDENGNVFLPLLGDEDEAPAPGNTPKQPATPERTSMRNYWTLTYEVGGDTLVAEVLDMHTGKYRVLEHIASDLRDDVLGSTPHAFLSRVQERKGKVISSETMHIVTDFDFDGVTRAELESFISALINYVTDVMFTSMQSREDFNELIKNYSLKQPNAM
jgi:hypothetical protein